MSDSAASRDAVILLEEGLRVLTAQIAQEDPGRAPRVIRGLARNATRAQCPGCGCEDDRPGCACPCHVNREGS